MVPVKIETTSQAAILDHYDVGIGFFEKMLGPSMTYSSALWEGPEQTLMEAQISKLSWHADQLACGDGSAILEIGCGFGTMLSFLGRTRRPGRLVGLSLSRDHLAYCAGQGIPDTELIESNWTDYAPEDKFDGIVSIGAFEHFATLHHSPEERRSVYRAFFHRCHAWLREGGHLSLQSIIRTGPEEGQPADFISAEIFRESSLPTLQAILEAAQGLFSVRVQRLDGNHYERTLSHWYANLMRNRGELEAAYGMETVKRFRLYLMHSRYGFSSRFTDLLRISFQRS